MSPPGPALARILLLGGWAALATIACGEASPPEPPLVAAAVSQAPPPSPAPATAPAHRFRGLWVLCEGSRRTLEDPGRIDQLMRDAAALDVTDLFVQVYRSGRAWYDATLADATPHRELLEQSGVDGLRYLLARAGETGLRVHAWVNVLSLNSNREAPILKDLGRQAVLVDRRGRSLLDYPAFDLPQPDRSWYRMGTSGLYLDPGAPGVRERLVATFVELLDRYPELAGLHLDYIRHPGVLPHVPGSRFDVGLDFGYGEASQQRFRAETGGPGPYRDPAHPETSSLVRTARWDDWRRAQVNELVSEIRTAALARHPDLLISAAVISYADRAYLTLAQDWRGWLAEELLDFAVPMIYTLDDRLFGYQVDAMASGPGADRIWAGVGVWLFARNPQRAVAQLDRAREAGSTGEVLFSYDALTESPELMAALVEAEQAGR